MNYNKVREFLVQELRYFMKDRNAVIGESGGVDSALITFLCVEALGQDRVIARTMPYGNQSTADADLVAKTLDIKNYGCINIKPSVDSFGFTKPMTIGNTKARVRMTNLYALAAENNGMVIGTSNKTEMQLGYFTKFGDGGCDVEPIGDLYKTEVWEVAKTYPNFPERIITKSPSAELWEGQTDEGEIGMSYEDMDRILNYFTSGTIKNRDDNLKVNETENRVKLSLMINKSEHKRHLPPTFYITIKR